MWQEYLLPFLLVRRTAFCPPPHSRRAVVPQVPQPLRGLDHLGQEHVEPRHAALAWGWRRWWEWWRWIKLAAKGNRCRNGLVRLRVGGKGRAGLTRSQSGRDGRCSRSGLRRLVGGRRCATTGPATQWSTSPTPDRVRPPTRTSHRPVTHAASRTGILHRYTQAHWHAPPLV